MFACPNPLVTTTAGCLKWRPSLERMPKTMPLSRLSLKVTQTEEDLLAHGNVVKYLQLPNCG
jgi:hypothetical protein